VGPALLHCLVSIMVGGDRPACPLLLPRAHGCLDKGTGCPARLRLVPSCENGRQRVAGTQPMVLDACASIDGLSACSKIFT
jgi:hypothetical protein